MKKEQVIEKVNESLGSLFTKSDVINCINMVEEPKVEEVSESKQDFIAILNLVRNKVERTIRDFDFNDTDNIEIKDPEFSIRYGNTIELDTYDIDARQHKQSIMEVISEAFAELEEEHETRMEIIAEETERLNSNEALKEAMED